MDNLAAIAQAKLATAVNATRTLELANTLSMPPAAQLELATLWFLSLEMPALSTLTLLESSNAMIVMLRDFWQSEEMLTFKTME
jgi:hypothetical protein